MTLHILGRCGNCNTLTSRAVGDAWQCKQCQDKKLAPVELVSKAKKKPTVKLPPHVEAVVDGATINVKSYDEENGYRVLVNTSLMGHFYIADDLSGRIEKAFPGLDESQVQRVIALFVARGKAAIANARLPGKPKRNFVSEWG
ncbi:helix-turn-helix domain-containing protein [Caballeronia sp. M23-90]